MDSVLVRRLLPGNRIEALLNGDNAYPPMIEAIKSAQRSVTFSTYIFDSGPVGQRFIEAFRDAVARGVQVRVIVDDAGARYSRPSSVKLLRKAGVPVARFLPALLPQWMFAMNMRNHRKILVVDGRIGFTGGMNIREGYCPSAARPMLTQDLHFRVEGPVVAHLQEVFADDWRFCVGESLRGEPWFTALKPCGKVLARGIAAGPDENFENVRWAILGRACDCAAQREDNNAVFPAGPGDHLGSQRRDNARRGSGHPAPREEQPAFCAVGYVRHTVADPGTRVQSLAVAASL